MKYLVFIFSLIILFACSDDTPECLEDRITQFQTDQADCPMASIKKYKFQGEILYGFSDGNCIADGGTILLNEACQQFCFVGGIASLSDCEGVNFFQNAEELELIWESR